MGDATCATCRFWKQSQPWTYDGNCTIILPPWVGMAWTNGAVMKYVSMSTDSGQRCDLHRPREAAT